MLIIISILSIFSTGIYYVSVNNIAIHYLLMKVYSRTNRFILESTGKTGLSPGQPKVLEYLKEHDGSNQKKIAGFCEIEPATVGTILTKMEKYGLIKRFRRKENQRSVAVTLTERGRKYSETVEKIFLQVEKKFESVLSDSELETLKTLLQKILEATENKKIKGYRFMIFFKRYFFLFLGLLIMSFGVAFSVKASLGTSPISSVPYVVSLISPLTVGIATIVMHIIFILIQIVLLRKDFKVIQLIQIPVAFIFGYLTDFSLWTIRNINPNSYSGQWILCIVGILLVGTGVSFEVNSKASTLAGEGVILAICNVFKVPFPKTKIGFDITLVITAALISVLFTSRISGIREGTVAAAIFVGMVAKLVNIPLKKFSEKYL